MQVEIAIIALETRRAYVSTFAGQLVQRFIESFDFGSVFGFGQLGLHAEKRGLRGLAVVFQVIGENKAGAIIRRSVDGTDDERE